MLNRLSLLNMLRKRRAVQLEFKPWGDYSTKVAGFATRLINRPPSRQLSAEAKIRNDGKTLDVELTNSRTGAQFRLAVSQREGASDMVQIDILDAPGTLRWGGIEYGQKAEEEASRRLTDWLRQQKLPAMDDLAPASTATVPSL
ncbi:MAG: hypothetical protein Alpg2KO_19530 [Alphaproteobacteria bacterium]